MVAVLAAIVESDLFDPTGMKRTAHKIMTAWRAIQEADLEGGYEPMDFKEGIDDIYHALLRLRQDHVIIRHAVTNYELDREAAEDMLTWMRRVMLIQMLD